MTTFVNNFHNQVLGVNRILLKSFLQTNTVAVNSARTNHFFKYLAQTKDHNEKDYEYEVSADPKEWEFVERLMPLETVPQPSEKPNYPSGWRPPSDKRFTHEFFIERSKNHMLPVYLNTYQRMGKITRVTKVSGDIWRLHNELKDYLEAQKGKKIASFVNEGSCMVNFRGDYVYFCEQWLLSKGF